MGGVMTIVLPRSVLSDGLTDPPDVRMSALTVPSASSTMIGRVTNPEPRLALLTPCAIDTELPVR